MAIELQASGFPTLVNDLKSRVVGYNVASGGYETTED